MKEFKGTPGPWKWNGEDYRGDWGWQILVGAEGQDIVVGESADGIFKGLSWMIDMQFNDETFIVFIVGVVLGVGWGIAATLIIV